MGVQGLRKFIDGSGCTRSLATAAASVAETGASPPPALVDHVLFDMNGVLHACYSREHTTAAQTIRAVLELLTVLLTRHIAPLMTLVLAIDGPPPIAKLATQRQRRRKVRHMDVASGSGHSDLSITVGHPFLVAVEQALSQFLIAAKEEGWLRCRRALIVGSSTIGEGEHKIARALHVIASDAEVYRPDASVVVVGNDIDLVLTCLGATGFTNLGVLSPSSLQFVDLSMILRRWSEGESAIAKTLPELSASRYDFIFAFILNGGDHFEGLGDVAAGLWRRYKLLRSANPRFRVFNATGTKIDVPSFAEWIGCDTSKPIAEDEDEDDGEAHGADDDEMGGGGNKGDKEKKKRVQPLSNVAKERMEAARAMFESAMWAFRATAHGDISDYRHVPGDTSGLTLANLRDAVMRLPSAHMTFKRSGGAPLVPILAFAAVMPSADHLPTAFQAAARKHAGLAAQLEKAKGPAEVVAAVTALWKKVDVEALTPAERALTEFGVPLDVPLPTGAHETPLPGLAKRFMAHGKNAQQQLPFDGNTQATFRDPLGRTAKTHLWRPIEKEAPPAAVSADGEGRLQHPRHAAAKRARSSDGLKQQVRPDLRRR
jgi:hypothetical protein